VQASPVHVEVVRLLRAEILRPAQTPDELRYPGDDAPETLHAAVIECGEPIAVASVMREPFPANPGEEDWRVRGMATRERARGRGAGSALLRTCIAHAREARGTVLWCNARVPAAGFYERGGLARLGIEGIGPHVLMWIALTAPG
jgi:GNAT superfamily N-acetyltransferase